MKYRKYALSLLPTKGADMAGKRDQGTTVTLVGKGDLAKLTKILGAGGKPGK
jgi:hypothetical protein